MSEGVELTARFLEAAGLISRVETLPPGPGTYPEEVGEPGPWWAIATHLVPYAPHPDEEWYGWAREMLHLPIPDWTPDAHLGDVLRVVRESGAIASMETDEYDSRASLIVNEGSNLEEYDGGRRKLLGEALMRAFIRAKGGEV